MSFYLQERRTPLEHRVSSCRGAWEVTYKPSRTYDHGEGLSDVQLLCRTCGHYHRLTATTDAHEEYRATSHWGHRDEDSPPRPPEQHRPHLSLLTGPLACLVESVPPIRAHGLTLVAVDQLRYGGAETVIRWEARDAAGEPVGLILRDQGPRGGELWAYSRFHYNRGEAPGATGYSTPRAAAKHLAQRLAADLAPDAARDAARGDGPAAGDPSGAAGGDS